MRMPKTNTNDARQITDDAVRAATGRGWDAWEALLDERGAAELPHKALVALLSDGLVENPWWAQNVASAYEKRKGRRMTGETADTGFQIGVRRTVPISAEEAWRLVTSPEAVQLWLGDAGDLALEKGAPYTTAEGESGEVRAVSGSHLRLTRQPPGGARGSTIQVRAMPSGSKAVLSFHEEHLPDADAREARRRHFESVLDQLQQRIAADG
jgi:uncharacterized protein YndB with AHSA1/START domain